MTRVTLVPVDRSHAPAMFAILADPALYQYTGGAPPDDAKAVERWFSDLETRLSPDGTEQWLTWIVQLHALDMPIGYMQATVASARADLAWLIGVDWQGQGYAREAAALLKTWLLENQIERATAHIHPDHSASQKIATALGLRCSGVFHEGEEVWTAQLVSPEREE